MTSFVIVADLRTGSTLLSTSLDGHPDVRCLGELFHPDALPDNQLPAHDRYPLSGREVVGHALRTDGVRAAGFRAMTFLPRPSQPRWADAWDGLAAWTDLRVISLVRRDALAQYASVRIAEQTRVWHADSPDDPRLRPENRPTLAIDPDDFRRWTAERAALLAERRRQLQEKPWLELDYETLTGDWPGTIRRVQEFLRVDPLPLSPAKQKQETRPLAEVIRNYADLMSAAGLCRSRSPSGT